MPQSNLLRRIFPVVAAAAFFIAVSTLTRAALALSAVPEPVGTAVLARSFAFGLLFDAIAACYALTPFALWLMLAPNALARTRIYRAITIALVGTACFATLFLAAAEWLFWEEFGARFNFIAVDYLLYTQEVIGNIWQSYPTGRLLLALALAAATVAAALARPVWRWSAEPLRLRTRGIALAALAGAVALSAALVDSDLKNKSTADAANELAGNGLYEFFSALRRNELSFERYYATLPPAIAFDTVRSTFSNAKWVRPGTIGLERLEPGRGAERRLNVVLVSIESMGAEYIGAYGDARGLTPNLDRLAKESLWFSRVYATGNRTVRGLEALSLALPPTPGQSIVRRPHNEKLFSLGSVFEDKDYTVLFAYGGYGYFDNMNAFFDANDYRVIDRRNIPAARIEFENVWGVADEHLYDQVIDEIDREKAARPEQPAFVHIMTTSNHRPYTYPPGRIDIPSGSGRNGAVKYTDYAVGRLIERARNRPWFADTVFVITADHGANARGGEQIPVDKYLIPLLVYSPAHIKPQRVDRLMSQIDIPPTLLGLLDFRYYTKFLGRDVLHSPPESDRAFVANFQTLGYMQRDSMVLLKPKRRVESYRMEGGKPVAESKVNLTMRREAIAFYQVASHAFRNGLYLDEEQKPFEDRADYVPAGVVARTLH